MNHSGVLEMFKRTAKQCSCYLKALNKKIIIIIIIINIKESNITKQKYSLLNKIDRMIYI